MSQVSKKIISTIVLFLFIIFTISNISKDLESAKLYCIYFVTFCSSILFAYNTFEIYKLLKKS
jgi:hypothetical protein